MPLKALDKLRTLRERGILRWKNAGSLLLSAPHAIYQFLMRDGSFRTRVEVEAMASFRPDGLVRSVVEICKPESVLDLGCGAGGALELFLEQGVKNVLGVEYSKMAISLSSHPDLIVRHDLRKPLDLGRKFDVVFSYECVEHIAPRHVKVLVENFTRHGDRIVLTAAPPGQGGHGHFNEQPSKYWAELFEAAGFRFDKKITEVLRKSGDEYAANVMMFLRFRQ